jgi:TldD protein
MHESVGHPTELDRVLGYELGFAGGSFASLDKLGSFRYGSPIVNFTADNRLRFGGASSGFDDEGVECQSFPIIREGVLVGYGTSRETARAIGLSRSNGTCRSTGWHDAPIVRIPNLFLEPGRERLSLEELIQDTKSGILMLGRDSFSIDQMRYNFQFGADMSWRIENGKLVEPLRDVIYQSISPEFWGACDAVCDEREWRMHGVFNCGKGQPMQAGKMMHGASPARFRQIRVGY